MAEYLGIHLIGILSEVHMEKQTSNRGSLWKMYWLFDHLSQLPFTIKVLIIKVSLNLCGHMEHNFRGSASYSFDKNMMIHCFQSNLVRVTTDAPWFVSNLLVVHSDFQTPTFIVEKYDKQSV